MLISFMGLAVFIHRFWLQRRWCHSPYRNHDLPCYEDVDAQKLKLSIIIPARNEESNLSHLLRSLQHLDFQPHEVIVVDDQSSDQTAMVARNFGVHVVSGREKPENWVGKQWALQQGADVATGDYLLFLDADVTISASGLSKALAYMVSRKADALSVCPYHETPRFWERLLGPFHLLVLLATAPYGQPRTSRLFAIGQFMLFRSSVYRAIGGHKIVKSSLTEDLDIARTVVEKGLNYRVYAQSDVFKVHMFSDFKSFFVGWKRLVRVGLPKSSLWAGLEVFSVVFAMTQIVSTISLHPAGFAPLALLLLFALAQKRFGFFSGWGVLFFFIPVILFMVIGLSALWDDWWKKPLFWRGRRYKVG